MTRCWLLITFSWFGTASLQYVHSEGPEETARTTDGDSPDTTINYPPLPYLPNLNLIVSPSSFDQSTDFNNIDDDPGFPRDRRTIDNKLSHKWMSLDNNYHTHNDHSNGKQGFIGQQFGVIDDNATEKTDALLEPQKKNFSPWGGKRNVDVYGPMWTWKRSSNSKQPSMPKRVRFSPWGGKRTGQMILKSGMKGTRILYSNNLSDVARLMSHLTPSELRIAGIQVIPGRRHPINFLTIPFQTFIANLPSLFQSGHPYSQVNLKKDGKRKVKFSSWGGKRSQPIIGPIWTPTDPNVKDASLDAIVLIRNFGNKRGMSTTTMNL